MSEMNLTDVLEAYALAARPGNDRGVLRQMIEKHPQFAEELRDFAAARAVREYGAEPEISAENKVRLRETGLRNLRSVLSGSAGAETALKSLTEAAKAKGMNRTKFAAAVGLSVSLIQYLEKRRLEFSSIPQIVIRKIAALLETGEEEIANYLRQPPVSTANASFKAEERPEESIQKTFADAVNEDQQLSPIDKLRLLEL